jgi:heme-degrading monooxygenase HmoA
MFIILWEYRVKPEKQSEFEDNYAPNGTWAELFNKSAGYLGTELLHDEANVQRYLTIDRWESKEEYTAFLFQYDKEYKTLDAQCVGLTESESVFGMWETL